MFHFEETMTPSKEKGQSPEEIRLILEMALQEDRPVDLVIEDRGDGDPIPTPDLYVEALQKEHAEMTYYKYDKGGKRNDEPEELIPLKLSRIKKAELKKHSA
jgi:hypothetical protein